MVIFMDVKKEILDAIEIIVDRAIKKYSTRIFTGVVKSINNGKANVIINGAPLEIPYFGNVPTVNYSYRVFVPDGELSQAFIINP